MTGGRSLAVELEQDACGNDAARRQAKTASATSIRDHHKRTGAHAVVESLCNDGQSCKSLRIL